MLFLIDWNLESRGCYMVLTQIEVLIQVVSLLDGFESEGRSQFTRYASAYLR
jgi:hypothetical protein